MDVMKLIPSSKSCAGCLLEEEILDEFSAIMIVNAKNR